MTDKRTILIAGMGTSPAVLTETVWALCHQKKPIVPDEIVVLVTKSGKERLCEELLSGEKPVWEKMLAALKKEKIKIDGKLVFGETSIRVIPDERGNGAWDLRSGEDNLRAADFMLRQIRQYTESSDVYCRGFGVANLRNFREVYLQSPSGKAIRYALRSELGWTHHRAIIRVANPKARSYYLDEAVACRVNWKRHCDIIQSRAPHIGYVQ